MKKVIVFPNRIKDVGLTYTKRVVDKMLSFGIGVCISNEHLDEKIENVCYYDTAPLDAELIVVIGGDGSVIDASRLALELDIPLLGVNLGKVGYLAVLDPDNIDSLSKIASDEYIISNRMLLCSDKLDVNGNVVRSDRLAVNDLIISRGSSPGIVDIKVESSSKDSVHLRCDGVVLATPTGTTAYSLSAGGPIVSVGLDSITVTPICPHSFFDRSVIYSPDEVISVTNLTDSCLNISIDGRSCDSLSLGETCRVYKSSTKIKMLSLEDANIFSTLTKKIKIMHDLV